MNDSKKDEYNDEPVFYCTKCLSLNIKGVYGLNGLDFCDDCGGTEIELAHINEWEKIYLNKYGFKYLDKY